MEPGAWGNKTVVTEFILLGLTENIELQPILFAIFLFAYVITVGGNLSILAAIFVEPKLLPILQGAAYMNFLREAFPELSSHISQFQTDLCIFFNNCQNLLIYANESTMHSIPYIFSKL